MRRLFFELGRCPSTKIPLGQRAAKIWTIIVLAFLYLPIVVLVAYSFNDSQLNIRWHGFTGRWYGVVFREIADHFTGERRSPLAAALFMSLWIAALTTVFSTVLGVLGAWLLHRYRFPGGRFVETALALPMVVPEVIIGVSLLILFSLAGIELGVATVVLAHTTFCSPFVLAAVKARLAGMDPALEEAARDLGASSAQAFLRVIVPWLAPAVISGALMSFTLSLDELIVTWFTRGPTAPTLPVHIYGLARVGLNPSLYAVSSLLVLATVFLVIIAEAFKRKGAVASA